jgi:acid phosphatase
MRDAARADRRRDGSIVEVARKLDRRSVLAGAAASFLAAAAPARAQTAPLSFLAIGDWGRRGHRDQREVADAMDAAARQLDSRLVLSAGDNFYPFGIKSVRDRQWAASFEDVYSAASLQTPWYAALGNHDYRGKPHAQIAYGRTSSRWRMPARYYVVQDAALAAAGVDVFVLDTTPIVGDLPEAMVRLARGRVSMPGRHPQVVWLEEALARSQAPWKIVVGHHPVRSGGHHGGAEVLVHHVEPLLEQYGVAAYVCGHDHSLQHIQVGRTHHVCTGAGSSAGPVEAVAGTRFALATPGFAAFTLDGRGQSLRLGFRQADGRVAYEAEIARA